MSMIERVAIEIGGLWSDYCNPCTPKKIVKCEDCLRAARAAIAAMREPTEEMIACAESQFPLFADEYKRAIDAALKE